MAKKVLVAYFSASGVTAREAQSLQAHCPDAVWKPGKLLNRLDAAAWTKSLTV